jgi:hypothetical protein
LVSPKPMHVGNGRIGRRGQVGERVHISNPAVYELLSGLREHPFYSSVVAPMRPNLLSAGFAATRPADYEDRMCLGPLTAIVVNASQELSVCCTAKLAGIGMPYSFTCGEALIPDVEYYYRAAVTGMAKFDSFYCIYGCMFDGLNAGWQDTTVLTHLRHIRARWQANEITEAELEALIDQHFFRRSSWK